MSVIIWILCLLQSKLASGFGQFMSAIYPTMYFALPSILKKLPLPKFYDKVSLNNSGCENNICCLEGFRHSSTSFLERTCKYVCVNGCSIQRTKSSINSVAAFQFILTSKNTNKPCHNGNNTALLHVQ